MILAKSKTAKYQSQNLNTTNEWLLVLILFNYFLHRKIIPKNKNYSIEEELRKLIQDAELKSCSSRLLARYTECWLLSLVGKHRFFNLFLCVANDIWLAIRVLLYQSLFNPLIYELSGSFICLRCFVQLLQLSLKKLDMLTLISDLGCTGLAIHLSDIVVSKLSLHVYLSATSFTTWLQYMDTSTLGGCWIIPADQ